MEEGRTSAGAGAVGGRAASKAGAYGGAELGGMVGRLVGPPVVGGIVGNLVGERVGETAVGQSGLSSAAARLNRDAGEVLGRRRADKVGEMALTALGYSNGETCLCCPCLPASQIMLFVMSGFFVYNLYRLGLGIYYDTRCTPSSSNMTSITPDIIAVADSNSSVAEQPDHLWSIARDREDNVTYYLVSYPCVFGFHYLVAGAAVWVALLPFYICTLFANCYRQCCCCLCDPIVCCATLFDCFKRCCCECGGFSLLSFIWNSACIFEVIWSVLALVWLVETLIEDDDSSSFSVVASWPEPTLLRTVAASIGLDLILAGSELVHGFRLFWLNRRQRRMAREAQADPEGEELKTTPSSKAM